MLILDLEGWGLKNFDSKVSTALAEIAKPFYPDYMGVCIFYFFSLYFLLTFLLIQQTFIVNYSWVIWGVWKLAKMLLDQRTQEKVLTAMYSIH